MRQLSPQVRDAKATKKLLLLQVCDAKASQPQLLPPQKPVKTTSLSGDMTFGYKKTCIRPSSKKRVQKRVRFAPNTKMIDSKTVHHELL